MAIFSLKAAADAATAASGQIASNVLEGKPPMEGTLDAMKDSVPGMGLVAAVQQRESCFLAGTSVTLGSGDKQAIETLVIGQRVLTPESTTQTAGAGTLAGSKTQVDPSTWRSYTVRLRDGVTKWDIFDITLLRPAGWMAEHSRPLGGSREVWVDFEELNARGWAEVIEERPCPKIVEGPGRVVTATITHANDDVRALTMSSGETLQVTGNHRMFSATRSDWVAVKDLSIGEELRTTKGRESVASLGFQRGRHQVYNIEVETEHCYYVGSGELLTHNTYSPTASDSNRAEGTHKQLNDAGVADSHHVIQHAAMKDIPGYNRDDAPAVQLDGPSTRKGSEHYNATQVQRERGGGTYGAERRIGYKAMRQAGLDKASARRHIERADNYFMGQLGISKSTPTGTVRNRNKVPNRSKRK